MLSPNTSIGVGYGLEDLGIGSVTTKYDLVVRGGTVVDGKGGVPIEADVAVRDGSIAAVGKNLGEGRKEIDARGQLVTPGFVDIHTHYDGQAVWDSRMNSSSWHGVTTAVMGNCGVGFAPVREEHQQLLIELMEGVEDIPGTALHEGLQWNWESFGEYLDLLDTRPRDIDLCAQLPHGALRVYVMGRRAARLEEATAEDIAEMRRLTADAMKAGAIGFSTSRTLNHKSVKGDPTPGLRASADELVGIALGMKDAGSGVFQLISDWNTGEPEEEFAMIRRIAEESGRPLSFSLSQRHSVPDLWQHLFQLVEDAVEDGLEIKTQCPPRPIGILVSLQGSRNPFSFFTTYQEIADKPLGQRVAIMRRDDFRRRLMTEIQNMSPELAATRKYADYERIFELGDPPDYEPPRESSVAARAASDGRDPDDLMYDLMLKDEGRNFLLAPFANYAYGNLDVCHDMLASPNTLVGLGDGGAHVGFIADSSYSTYLLAHWGRDRPQGRFPIEYLVKKHTADNARAVGLRDRGTLEPGMKADINVIDFDKLNAHAPYMVTDLPAGGSRLLQHADGYTATVVSGAVTYRDGDATGALPGRLVRGPQPEPA